MEAKQVRQVFLDFFKTKEHTIVSSAPMVIKNDPTLMFTNAGMNQFKDIFLGNHPPKSPRIANTQKCLRVSGKHNDLEEVGHDTYHHTFFEMLGNWSFGNYFKKEAISWAWELLTEVFKIPKENLYVTVFEGSDDDGLEADNEAKEIWKSLIPENRILYGSKKDNFWEMGESGPCGPCSEIHVDIRTPEEKAKLPGKELVNKDHPQVIEVWNLVFIQYNRLANGQLHELPAKHIDTGMGFERLCMVIQEKQSNYDTDVFQPLLQKIAEITTIPYPNTKDTDVAMRVIADHLRTIAFSIADGQLPSNTGAGYVIRRILRRAVRYAYSFLDVDEPIISKLVPVLSAQLGDYFTELKAQEQLIVKVIHEEELNFLRTLHTGLERIGKHFQSDNKSIPGNVVFELYDTYGFPPDLTALIANEKGFTIDNEGFQVALEAQKNRSRQAAKIETGDWTELGDQTQSFFTGYDELETETKILKYREIQQKADRFYQIVLEKTPFYAESGGQVGDKGFLISGNEKIEILNTKKENDLSIHITSVLPSDIKATFKAVVNAEKRRLTERNHSATHLLHYALRKVLGEHVEQKGSLVDDQRLRFDFSHFQKVSAEEIQTIEQEVNALIAQNINVKENREISIEEAQKMGALALFGEKYGDSVRVIGFGKSVELCGGTHVDSTAAIGRVVIVSESAIAAGIRRIEAISSVNAESYIQEKLSLLEQMIGLMKNPKEPLKALAEIIEQNTVIRKQFEEIQREKAGFLCEALANSTAEINGVNYIAANISGSSQLAKDIAYKLSEKTSNMFLLIGHTENDKAGLALMISQELVEDKQWNASVIIRELAKHIQGGGGGQAFFATAGGKNPSGIPAALEAGKEFLKR